MLHFMVYKEPIPSAMLPDDQLSEALPKFNADFSLAFFFFFFPPFWCVWCKHVFKTTVKGSGRSGHLNWEHPSCERGWILEYCCYWPAMKAILHRALPSVSPSSYKVKCHTPSRIETYERNNIITPVYLIWLLAVDFFLPFKTEGTIRGQTSVTSQHKATGQVLWGGWGGWRDLVFCSGFWRNTNTWVLAIITGK